MIGEKFGKWEVLKVIKQGREKNWQPLWLCRCECGIEKPVHPSNLKSGKSSGCSKCSSGMARHRKYQHPLYAVWTAMKQRCMNPTNRYYNNYGARGITVAEEWVDSPETFIEWCLNNGWKKGLQLDRKNNDGPYSPNNCRFITQQENLLNSRLISSRNSTGYRGVSIIKQRTQTVFRAAVTFKGQWVHIGHFSTQLEAAKARDKYCVDNNLPLPLNFPGEGEKG